MFQFTVLLSIDCITSISTKSQNHTMSMTSQGLSKGISEKHGQVEKGRHNFRKKSPFGIRLEYILKLLMTAYRKKNFENQD